MTLTEVFSSIANAIRSKTGKTATIKPVDMATEIESIQTGSGGNPLQEVLDNQEGDGKPSCNYLFYNYKGTSLDSVLNSLDFSKVTNMGSMFNNCSKLTSIPLFDTSKVTNMVSMFSSCSYLNTMPVLDTSSVTNMVSMFYYCPNLTTIPLLNTSNVTNMGSMFERCSKITTIPQFDTSKVTNMNNMFNDCPNLTTIPLLNTSNVTNMGSMFQSCSKLTSIPQLDTSKVTNMDYMFYNCKELKEIHMTGMKVNFSISSSTKFTESALVEILNNLATVTSTKKLTMGSTNLAKLTDEEKAIATNKGWTLA